MSRFVFLGDFSGLSLFLSRGLESVGADVVLYSNGDHWKNLPRGRNVWVPAKGRVASVLNQFSGYQSLLKELTSKDTLVLATEYLFNRATDGLMMLRLIQRLGAQYCSMPAAAIVFMLPTRTQPYVGRARHTISTLKTVSSSASAGHCSRAHCKALMQSFLSLACMPKVRITIRSRRIE